MTDDKFLEKLRAIVPKGVKVVLPSEDAQMAYLYADRLMECKEGDEYAFRDEDGDFVRHCCVSMAVSKQEFEFSLFPERMVAEICADMERRFEVVE